MISTDILVIGAYQCGLFTAEAGLLKLHLPFCGLFPIAGGQCAELYPKSRFTIFLASRLSSRATLSIIFEAN